jgi:RND family efflux transporter MFP subunit
MSTRIRRAAEAVAGVAVLSLAVAWLSGGCEERIAPGVAPEASGAPVAASAPARALRGPEVEWASGAVESARRTAVASRILARIEEVRVAAGSEVSEGDLLVRLDARELSARVREVEEALRGARATLELARTERERAARLLAEGVGTRQALDRAEGELGVARAEVDRLTESAREARAALSQSEIRSPVSGRVVDRLAEPGDTAVPGRPLLRIYDPSVLRVEVPVRESLAIRLEVGRTIDVRIPSLEQELAGVIDEIVPFAEPGARTLLVKIRLPQDARLFAGMFARAAIPAGLVERVVVPRAAVERVGQLAFVAVVDEEGRARRRLVTTGPETGEDGIEILSGLAPGERVALDRPRS